MKKIAIILSGLLFMCLTSQAYHVIFQVDMTNMTGFTEVQLNGTFNGWCGNCIPMTDANSDNIWEVEVPLEPGNYEYKFTADSWNMQENLTPGSSCTVTNGGYTNRSLQVVDADIVLPVVCWGACTSCSSTQPVTFQVDMTSANFSFSQPTVNGTFNGWSGNANPLSDANSDGVYETTINLAPGTYEFKFATDNWSNQENLTPGSSCTVTNSGYTNRTVTVTDSEVIMSPVCWGSCSACNNQPATYNVSFSVDMSQATGFSVPELNGTFNNWCGNCNAMSDNNSDGIWDIVLALPAGTYEFKYSYDNWAGSEQLQEGLSCTVTNGGYTNRVITINGDTTIPVVCFGLCTQCQLNTVYGCKDTGATNYNPAATVDNGTCTYNTVFNVDMTCADAFTDVYITGPWCGWCAADTYNHLTDADGDGIYSVSLIFPAGNVEYKYMVDNWASQENLIDDMQNGATCAPVTDYANYANRLAPAGANQNDVYGRCSACVTPPTNYNVTFQVDMSQQTGFTTPEVNGTFNNWCGNCTAMSDANGDNIWDVTVSIPAGTYEFKYSYDAWAGQENLTPGSSCTVTNFGYTNRSLVVSQDTTLGVVCFGLCTACQTAPTLYNVTFQVDMSQQTGFSVPEVNGTFNNWCGNCTAMSDANGDNIWDVTVALAEGSYEFKYSYDAWAGQENLTPGSSCTVTNSGYTNRSLVVSQDTTLNVVCFGLCTSCQNAPTLYNVTFQVDMNQQTGFTTPEVNGTFNNWCGNCAAMSDANGDNVWDVTVALAAGTYEFKYSYDNWGGQENLVAGSSCTVTNFGFTNRSLVVSQDAVLDVVCFASCSSCQNTPPTRNVTFQVNMSQATGFTTPELNGTFNNWCGSCAQMSDANGDNIWDITVPLQVGTYEFKYSYDNWAGSENLTAGDPCTITNGAFTNRSLNIVNDTILPVVCFGSCSNCVAPALYPVIFQVDVNDPTITEVELAGQFNGFCAGCEPMQNTSGTIWTDTLYLPGGSYNYYFTQSSGTIAENLTDMSCTAFNGVSYLRTLTVIESTEAPLVCWNTCSPCTVGQEEINNHSIQLYPNPSNGNISFSGLGGGQYQVSCFDMMGHLVQRFSVSAENKNVQLKNIEQGIYIIRIDGEQTSQQFNMVICE
jgi:1,4-alpha-glucan branching enzyme